MFVPAFLPNDFFGLGVGCILRTDRLWWWFLSCGGGNNSCFDATCNKVKPSFVLENAIRKSEREASSMNHKAP